MVDLLPWWSLSLITCIALACMAAPAGSLLIWNRMAFYGDALAHGSLLGIGIGLTSGVIPEITVLLSCLLIGLSVNHLHRLSSFSADTLLAIVAHSLLAVGLLILFMLPNTLMRLEGVLLGDILAIGTGELIYTGVACVLVLSSVLYFWNPLLLTVIHEEIAMAEGTATARMRYLHVLITALTVAVGIRIAGVLLISALLIIPAAAARCFARTPGVMVVVSALFGVTSVLLGFVFAFHANLPLGPVTVASASCIFILALVYDILHGRLRLLRRSG
jgi:zinc transport system permease protein